MSLFNQIELLPVTYFIILMCVVCANVLAKLMGERLVNLTSGSLKQLLAVELNIPVTGDTIEFHLFEQQLIEKIHIQLLFKWNIDFTRWMGREKIKSIPAQEANPQINLYPQIYWSGCPPNLA